MPFLTGRRSLSLGAAAVVVLVCGAPANARQRALSAEPDIKAAFLFNFTKFVEWPDGSPDGAFQICTVADPAFDSVLAQTLSGESTAGRAIVRTTPAGPERARGCHILFIGRSESGQIERWIAAVRGQPVLIVGETKAAEDAGAHVTFVVEDNRVRFDVNEDAAARSGLQVSSKMLRVARHVTPKGGS